MTSVSASLMASTKRGLDEVTVDAVSRLAAVYAFPLDEALQKLSIGEAAVGPPPCKKALVAKSASSAKGGPSPPAPPTVILPFCGVVVPTWCHGVRYNRGLFTQCTNDKRPSAAQSSELCPTCAKVSSRPVSCGDISERADPSWRDRRGRKPVKYSVVAAKLGIVRADAEAAAAKLGWTIPESEFAEPGPLRRGRPPKDKPIVSSVGNNLLDDLVKSARDMTITPLALPAGETQTQRFHRLFGTDSDSDTEPLDTEALDVAPVFVAGTEYLHCASTSALYDLHTQVQVGKLSPEGRLVAC